MGDDNKNLEEKIEELTLEIKNLSNLIKIVFNLQIPQKESGQKSTLESQKILKEFGKNKGYDYTMRPDCMQCGRPYKERDLFDKCKCGRYF